MDADIIVTCPYNPAHRIRKYKLMNHMTKCKKTSKIEGLAECPLDKSHIVGRDHLKKHIASCSSLGKLVNMDIGYDKPKVAEPPIFMNNAYGLTENWEEEPEVPSYNPMEVSSKRPVIRCVSGLTKSERRKFKENERKRIAELKEFPSVSEASSSMKDDNEVPLRPPRDTVSSTISQDFDKNMHDHDNDHDTDIQPFVTDSFYKLLYDELAPEDDSIKQLEQSLRDTVSNTANTKISLRDYFYHATRENGNFSDDDQEAKVKKTETATTSELNIDDKNKERDECIASASSVSSEQAPSKLLALLKQFEPNIKKSLEGTKIDQTNKDPYEKEGWDEILTKYNERLSYLTDLQNAAAEESAQILQQLEELKLCEEIASRK